MRDVAWCVRGSRALERDTRDQSGNSSGKKCVVIKFGWVAIEGFWRNIDENREDLGMK